MTECQELAQDSMEVESYSPQNEYASNEECYCKLCLERFYND